MVRLYQSLVRLVTRFCLPSDSIVLMLPDLSCLIVYAGMRTKPAFPLTELYGRCSSIVLGNQKYYVFSLVKVASLKPVNWYSHCEKKNNSACVHIDFEKQMPSYSRLLVSDIVAVIFRPKWVVTKLRIPCFSKHVLLWLYKVI